MAGRYRPHPCPSPWRGGECRAACPSPSCVPLVASARKRSSGGECHAACPSPSCVPLVASARKRSSGGEGSAMRLVLSR
ncbi:MAG: hypothetical protein IJT53_05250 [Prevotella sp.]|nr:hypothetical protein [Prevotella sp.]